MSHPLIRITIYTSLVAYILAFICWVSRQRGRSYRILWSVGCVAMCGHAVAAFHFYHKWSHADAVALTAKETQAVLGEPYGNGIWFSYLLLVLWSFDAIMAWIPRYRTHSLGGWLTASIHAYVFFILFNGTVIFEHGSVRWAGIIGTIWALRMAWRFRSAPIAFE